MSDNPFSEPEDDRTVIRPQPGGRRTSSAVPAPGATSQIAPVASRTPSAEEPLTVPITVTPLAAAAAPLLQLLARLRNTLHRPDTANLHDRTVHELREFERRAREAGISMDQLRPAHFALCASIDDVVLNTPWGAGSGWVSHSLLATLHQASHGPNPLADLLRQLQKNPAAFRPALELIYLCLSLGTTARSEPSRDAAGSPERLREEIYALLGIQPGIMERALSPHWQGISAPYRPKRGRLPVWVVATFALAACGGLFVLASTRLNAASDELQARVLAASPSRMPQLTRVASVQPLPPPPAPPEPTLIDRLRKTMQPEIDKGLVSVLGTTATPIVRISSRAMFSANGASVQPAFAPILQRIAETLNEPGRTLQVIGYTDNQPIRTVQFPSNFQLSTARAQAVRASIARAIGNSARVTAEGRADADPVASNATPEGRAQNGRIEIVPRRQD